MCILTSRVINVLRVHVHAYNYASEVTSSQPVHCHGDGGGTEGVDGAAAGGGVAIESFTQPSRFDELIVGTQIPCTPGASQVS